MKFNNVSVSYGDKNVLSSFSAEFDGLTCIFGPSGCGKTTLLRTAAGLIKPQSGTIEGVPEKISFMFQEDRLFPWMSVLENVAVVMPSDKKHTAIEFLRKVELENEADSLPDSLSGGMKRRVALARALAYDGDMLILDEPFKGLDYALIERLVPLIKELDIPVIVSTHSPEERLLLGGTQFEMK